MKIGDGIGPGEIRTLVLVLTAACNLRCRYCYQGAKRPERMEWRTLRAALDVLLRSRAGSVRVSFTGGEPLLEYPSLRRAVRYVESGRPNGMQVRFDVTTNGTLLSPGIASFLDERLFDLQLSFDGVPEAQNERGTDTFRVLDRLLGRLRERHPEMFRRRLTIGVTVTPSTVPLLPASIDYFLHAGVARISIRPSIVWDPAWRPERASELERAFERVYESSARHLRATGEVPVLAFDNRGFAGAAEGRPMCGIVSADGVAVDVDGRAYGCSGVAAMCREPEPAFLRECVEPMRIGSIHDASFPGRYASFGEAVRRAGIFTRQERKRSTFGRCADCPHLAVCSVCPLSIARLPGNRDPDRMNDFCCAFNRASLKYRDRFPRRPDWRDVVKASAGLAATRRRWEALARAAAGPPE